ncbi:GNAT family N-acetyltransferase [Paenibacillus sp. FA6]|uniref:GNAT family N-acetyltransferase n=1 Tax=Paenibacillus sp. FA6 TaxID=3413029 RepID=UPI003F6606CE
MNSSLSTPTLCIRKFQWDDLESLNALMRELSYPTTLSVMRERMQEMESSPVYCTLIAEVDNKVVGEISLRNIVTYSNTEPTTQITSVVVAKDYQGQGIGKRLIHSAEEWGKGQGSNLLFLKSGNRVERAPARAFYKHIGFTNIGYHFSKTL